MKGIRIPVFLAVVFWSMFMFASGALYRDLDKLDEPMSCEAASAEVMAMNACLANRPGCIIPNGPPAFKLYHEARRRDLECEDESEQRSSQDTRVQEGGG